MGRKKKDHYTSEQAKATKVILAALIEKDKEGKKLSRYDYFLLGGIDFKDALLVAYQMKDDKVITFSEYCLLNDYIKAQRETQVYRRKENIMAIIFNFKGREISSLEKQDIWDELIAAGIDENNIDDLVFSAAVRAYAIRKGYFTPEENQASETSKKR